MTAEISEPHLKQLLATAKQISQGDVELKLPPESTSGLGPLGQALLGLCQQLQHTRRQQLKLDKLTASLNSALMLPEALDGIYREFKDLIPYNRIGLALLEPGGLLRAVWARSDGSEIFLRNGFAAPLEGSSLEVILQTGRPRILNDLEAYLESKPDSASTRLIVREGMRASLTCPLVVQGEPVGFLFFSSRQPKAYADEHVEVYQSIAAQLSVLVERSRLVSDLAASKAEIERKNEALQRLNELKNTFVAIAAHDLRSPLSYVHTAINLLTGADAEMYRDNQEAFLEGIERQVQHMVQLVDDLLDLSEIEAGRFKLHRQDVKLSDLLDETRRVQSRLAEGKGTRLLLDLPSDGIVQADPARLRQVLHNLVSNAVKYSPPGSLVRLSAAPLTNGWRVSITDQGPGIREEERHKLFQPYQRLSTRPTGGEKSTGLGLAICRSIVDAHGGEIGVDSLPGQGATFWFTLPAEVQSQA